MFSFLFKIIAFCYGLRVFGNFTDIRYACHMFSTRATTVDTCLRFLAICGSWQEVRLLVATGQGILNRCALDWFVHRLPAPWFREQRSPWQTEPCPSWGHISQNCSRTPERRSLLPQVEGISELSQSYAKNLFLALPPELMARAGSSINGFGKSASDQRWQATYHST